MNSSLVNPSRPNRATCTGLLTVALLGLLALSVQARIVLIPKGTDWSYNVGEDPPTDDSWFTNPVDGPDWKSGLAPFGYGGLGPQTWIGNNRGPSPVTAYFRTTFYVDDPAKLDRLEVYLQQDDGTRIYLNGKPFLNSNLPDGPLLPTTLAKQERTGMRIPYSTTALQDELAQRLVKGVNTLAAEVHQYRAGSKDMIFDFGMSAMIKGTTEQTVIEKGSEWKFRDTSTPPPESWTAIDFDDSSWEQGPAILGYGDKDLGTELDSGTDPKNKPVTAWFRKEFQIDENLPPGSLHFQLLRDDGAVIYLNGRELVRDNLPPGYLDAQTTAIKTINWRGERRFNDFVVDADALAAGRNVVAVEIHQSTPASSDLGFDLILNVTFLPKEEGGRTVARKEEPAPVRKPVLLMVTDLKVVAEAKREDWVHTAEQLLERAMEFHAAGKLQEAVRGYYAHRWSEVFADRGYELDPGMKVFFLGGTQSTPSQEFFDLVSAYDDQDGIYDVLERLYQGSAESFRKFPKLALAIALVYDQRPERGWPHYQVPAHILPRTLPDPVEAFKFWVGLEEGGKALHPLDSLSIEEMKYLVDTPVPLEELRKAQAARVSLNNLPDLYDAISYSHERLENNDFIWPHASYALAEIRERGGICVDQAYYASQMAKAHGVPAMIVSGAGQNGNHAWIGFLDKRERWNFEVGRHAGSKYVTGTTFDPQTWQQPTDHQLAFLTERFQGTTPYRLSRIHSLFAAEYLKRGGTDAAIKACETAIKHEDRNLGAWETLIEALKAAKRPEAALDQVYQDGAKAFRQYADLEASFLRRLCGSFEAQGRRAEAKDLRDSIITRNRRERPDLALAAAKEDLEEAMTAQTPDEQLALYKQHLGRFQDAGLVAYYAITEPFLSHHATKGDAKTAHEALKFTRRRMNAPDDTTLQDELAKWEERLATP